MTVEVYNQNRGIPMGAQSLTPSGGGGTGGASIDDSQVSTTTTYSSDKIESRLAEAPTPDNMLTTNTDQVITGNKTFHLNQQSKKITLVDAGSTTNPGAYITLGTAGSYGSNVLLGTAYDYYYGGKKVELGTIPLTNTINAPGIRMYSGSATDATYLAGGGVINCGYLKMSGSELTFTNASGKETNLLASGGGDTMLTGTTTQDFDVSTISTKPTFYKRWKFRSAPDVYQQIQVYQGGIVFDDLCAKTLRVNPDINSYGSITGGLQLDFKNGYGKIDTDGSSSYKLVLKGGDGQELIIGSGTPKVNIGNYPSTQTLHPILTSYNTKAGDGISITTEGDNITISATGGAAAASYNGQHFLTAAEAAHAAMQSKKYTGLALGATGSTYPAPADGFFLIRLKSTSAQGTYIDTVLKLDGEIINTATYTISFAGEVCSIFMRAPKDSVLEIVGCTLTYDPTNSLFRFIYTNGSAPAD